MILGADGKPMEKEIKSCPKCGSGPQNFVPSGGFGELHMICSSCGNDFNKELKCQPFSS